MHILLSLLFYLITLALYVVLFLLSLQIALIPFDLWARRKGAFFAPSRQKKIQVMLDLAGSVKRKKVVDLGSGDGRIVVAFARAGAKVIGYEINPVLVLQSRVKLWLFGLANQAEIEYHNFWQVSLRDADVVVFYGIDWMMERLEKKLKTELRPGARVISNAFTFPTWKPKKEVDGVFVYEKK